MRICAFVRVRHVRVWGRARVWESVRQRRSRVDGSEWGEARVALQRERGRDVSGSEGGISEGARAAFQRERGRDFSGSEGRPRSPKNCFFGKLFFLEIFRKTKKKPNK